MSNLNLKFRKTLEMKRQKASFHSDEFPKRAKIYDKLHERRVKGKPIDGKCFTEAGIAIREMKEKGIR